MKRASIVLGLGFGDEGKGITTNNLCSRAAHPIVIRFSGGQQAGHTVMRNGIKHVHSSFGAGTLDGVPSYFSEHCTFYLNTIVREKKILYDKGIEAPKLILHPLAKVTTPYDVAYNRAMELMNKHGSCGLGVAATMKRNLETGYKMTALDLKFPQIALRKLKGIQIYYADIMHKTGSDLMWDEYSKYVAENLPLFEENMKYKLPFLVRDYNFLNRFDDFIFEGSQGILLDMDHGIFPNVTFANTTSKNALEICARLKVPHAQIYYVTRCYQTRHGRGWMSKEDNGIQLVNNHEEINTYNQWQEGFRIGELDYNLLEYSISVDKIYRNKYGVDTSASLVVSCLDQRPDFEFDKEFMDETFEFLGLDAPDGKLFDL